MFKQNRQKHSVYAYKGRRPDFESGPFYSGVDVILAIPQFAIRLCSPVSTSAHMEVSMNFAKRDGMIIELNNNKSSDTISWFKCLPSFDCDWISKYPDEAESVFVGGLFTIKVESNP